MPELPEVSIMTEKLREWITPGSVIRFVSSQSDRFLSSQEIDKVVGKKILNVFTAGKKIIFQLSEGFIYCHCAMSGYWNSSKDHKWTFDYVEGKRVSKFGDVVAAIQLDSPELPDCTLFFHDQRKFGRLRYVENFQELFEDLGPEVLETDTTHPSRLPQISIIEFDRAVCHSKPIKELLTDQGRMAGVGNIYVTEALWEAGIHPETLGSDLNVCEIGALLQDIRYALKRSISENLDYEKFLSVYRRKSCRRCLSDIEKIEIKKRSTYFCPKCQVKKVKNVNINNQDSE